MAYYFNFDNASGPDPRIVEMDSMVEAINRLKGAHANPGLLVWSGASRVGKTYTAAWCEGVIEEAWFRTGRGYKAKHFEVTRPGGGDQVKRGLQALYSGAIKRLGNATYKHMTAEDIADILVTQLQKLHYQILFVDEAGLLTIEAVNGMVLALNLARKRKWPLTIVLIGMNDLPTKLKDPDRPQVYYRVHEWHYFRPYTIEQTHHYLGELHSHFTKLRLSVPEERAQIEFLHTRGNATVGRITPLFNEICSRSDALGVPITLNLMKAVYKRRLEEEASARFGASNGYPTIVRPGDLDLADAAAEVGQAPGAWSDDPGLMSSAKRPAVRNKPTKKRSGRQRRRAPTRSGRSGLFLSFRKHGCGASDCCRPTGWADRFCCAAGCTA